jgi:hypothetical protein
MRTEINTKIRFIMKKKRTNALIALMMEAVSTSEPSVNFYQTARRNISEDCDLQDTVFKAKLLKLSHYTP